MSRTEFYLELHTAVLFRMQSFNSFLSAHASILYETYAFFLKLTFLFDNFRGEVVANLHSYIGNAYLEMGEYEKALDFHKKDLDFAKAK